MSRPGALDQVLRAAIVAINARRQVAEQLLFCADVEITRALRARRRTATQELGEGEFRLGRARRTQADRLPEPGACRMTWCLGGDGYGRVRGRRWIRRRFRRCACLGQLR